ncbi:MAG TPA: hypothetical protein PKA41_09550 [Verrucomicrobiota bacterium]|nr:hypothetical protein [Verrucomicrobiota bacterium]
MAVLRGCVRENPANPLPTGQPHFHKRSHKSMPVAWTNVGTHTGTNFVAPISVTDTNKADQACYRLKRTPSP